MSFAYNASAVALGGNIVLPSPTIIYSQASAALAPTGGAGTQTVNNFNYNGIITFDEASVFVTGSQDGDRFNTLSTVTIRNLNVLNVLQADRLVASITSSHKKGAPEGEITFQGTSVDNLRIAGRDITPRFNHGFYSRYPTYEALTNGLRKTVDQSDSLEVKAWVEAEVAREKAKGDPLFDEVAFRHDLGCRNVACLVADRFCWNRSAAANGAPDDHGSIHCSLADDIPGIEEVTEPDPLTMTAEDLKNWHWQHPVRRNGYVIKVKGFGTIKLAEMVIKPGERRINLFRLELGCPITGSMTVGSASTNGTELIP
jgi:hypothetical protein